MDWKIELIFVPVTDVDRAKDFYEKIGFNADHDQVPFEGLRFVQMTPPAPRAPSRSATGWASTSSRGGRTRSRSWCPTPTRPSSTCARSVCEAKGVDEQAWGRFVSFDDPDGNTWTLQELPNYGV